MYFFLKNLSSTYIKMEKIRVTVNDEIIFQYSSSKEPLSQIL